MSNIKESFNNVPIQYRLGLGALGLTAGFLLFSIWDSRDAYRDSSNPHIGGEGWTAYNSKFRPDLVVVEVHYNTNFRAAIDARAKVEEFCGTIQDEETILTPRHDRFTTYRVANPCSFISP